MSAEIGKREFYNVVVAIVSQLCGYDNNNRELILAKIREVLNTMPFESTT